MIFIDRFNIINVQLRKSMVPQNSINFLYRVHMVTAVRRKSEFHSSHIIQCKNMTCEVCVTFRNYTIWISQKFTYLISCYVTPSYN